MNYESLAIGLSIIAVLVVAYWWYKSSSNFTVSDIDKIDKTNINWVNHAAAVALGERMTLSTPVPGDKGTELIDNLKKDTLGRTVMLSHKNYVDDTRSNLALLGPSREVVRDDYNPIVQFQGLPRYYKDVGKLRPGMRETPSETDATLVELASNKPFLL